MMQIGSAFVKSHFNDYPFFFRRGIIFFFVLFLLKSSLLTAQLELVVRNGEVPCNSAFSVEVYVNNFNGLNNLAFTLSYDNARVSYSGFQNLFPSGNATTIPGAGTVEVFWASGGPPLTLANGTVVLVFEFTHTGNCDEPFIIHIVNQPTPVLAAGPAGGVDALIFGAVFLVQGDCQVEVNAGEDQFVCEEGDLTQLNGQVSGDVFDFYWEPANLISDPFSLSTTATVPDNPTIFRLVGRSESHNIVYNTHFDFGYAGFFSDYEYDEDDISQGNAFAVANSPDIVFSNFPLCSDHTGNNGNMIIVNGVNAPAQKVWCQYIEVQEGIEYQLEAYINTLTSFIFPQAQLQFSVDGDFVGNIFDPPSIPCFSGWVRMHAGWTATTDGTITFCIYNHQGNVSPVGNGFIVDDIAMYPICELEDEVSVEILEPAELFLEEKICWNQQPFEVNGQFFSESGNYTIVIERPGECDSTVYLNLEVIELEILVDNPGLINCYEPVISIDATFSSSGDNIEYIWSTTNGNILSGLGTPVIEVGAGGNYFLQLLYDDGDLVCQTDEIPFVVEENKNSPEVYIAGPDVIDCDASEIELEAVVEPGIGIYGYEWAASGGGNIIGPDFEATVTVDAAGFYQLIVTDFGNGCSDTSFFEVGFSADFPVAEAGGDRIWNCNDSLLILDGSLSEQGVGISYLWTTSDGMISAPADEVFLQILSPGTYVLQVSNSDNGCVSTDTVSVRLPDVLPELIPVGDSLVNCRQPIAHFGFLLSSDSLESIFSWTTFNGEIISGLDSSEIEADAGGWYIAEVFFPANGCTVRDSIFIVEDFNFPIADAGRDTVLGCSPPAIVLDGSNSDTSAQIIAEWTGGNIIAGANSFFPTINQAGTYLLAITDTLNGCSAIDSVVVFPSDDLPQISFEGIVGLSCAERSGQIQAVVSPDNFTPVFDWSASEGDFEVLGDSSSIVVNSGGIYVLTVIFEENQCSSSGFITIEEDTLPPVIQFLTMDSLYCGNEEVAIEIAADSNEDLNYSWIGPPGGIISGAEDAEVLAGSAGWYFITVVNESSGCFSTDSIFVDARFDLPLYDVGQSGQLDCSGGLVVLELINSDGLAYEVGWSTNNGNIVSNPSDYIISADQAGLYYVTVIHPFSNCIIIDSVEVVNNSSFPVANAGFDQMLNCRDSLVELDGTLSEQGPGISYFWTTTSGNIASGETGLNPIVDAPGIYYLTVINTANSCSSVDSVIVGEDRRLPVFSVEGNTRINCRDSFALLELVFEPEGNFTAEWYSPPGELLISGEVYGLSVSMSGEYEIRLTDTDNHCESSLSIIIEEDFTLPIARIDCIDCEGCINLPLVLDANTSSAASGELIFRWSTIGGSLEDLGSGRITVNTQAWYYLEVEDVLNGCAATDSILIESQSADLPAFQLFFPDCQNARGEIQFEEFPDIVFYSIDGGLNWQESPVFSGLMPGLFELTIRRSDGCESEMVAVELPDLRTGIDLFIPSEITVNSGGTIELNIEVLSQDTGPLTYSWSPPGLFSCDNCPDPTVGPVSEDLLISVQAVSPGGCFGQAESLLRISKDSMRIYIPNAFSPNNDGINDRLVVFASEGVEEILSFSIYSRWGEVLFSRENFPPNDEAFGWDGTANDQDVMPGAYIVIVEVEDDDGSIITFSKTVVLIR